MPVGDLISATDYNTIRNTITSVVGTGSASRGYGQTINASSAVTTTNQVTKAQWDLLRFDIYNALLHQTGSAPSIVTVGVGDVVRFGVSHPNSQYSTLATTADTNRFNVGTGQFLENLNVATRSTTDGWTSQAYCDVTVTFGTADQARYFFNSGGKIRITTTRTGGSGTAQNSSWSTVLTNAGARNYDGIGFYSLTSSFSTYYTATATGAYSANTYRLQARVNVANNSAGTATILTIRVLLTDPYTDPPVIGPSGPVAPSGPFPPSDGVDGTLTTVVDEIKATGFLQPSGAAWSVASPTVSTAAWVRA
jgi:hypothetical protein